MNSNRSEAARNRLVEHHLGLVEAIAHRLWCRLPRHAELDLHDLCGEGVLGLMGAIERFDAELGLRFSSFATLRIQGAMQDALRRLDFVPRTERAKARRGLVETVDVIHLQDAPRDAGAVWSWVDLVGSEPADVRVLSEGWLAPVLDALGPEQRTIVVQYWLGRRTMRQIGFSLGLCESRISQMAKALAPRLESLCRRHLLRE